MDYHGWIALGTLVAAGFLFLTRKIPIEMTALGIPVVLFVTGTVPDPTDALMGFGNHAVIAIASVFILGAGLQESGVAAWIARWVQRVGGSSESKMIVVICSSIALLSAFMSNAAAIGVLLPAAIALARRTKVAPSRLLMPMGYAAILGGNLTLIGTTPNLLVSAYMEGELGEGFGMFDFALIGIPLVVAGILYLVLVGRRLLPTYDAPGKGGSAGMAGRLAHDYGVAGGLTRLQVGKNSSLLGKTISEAALGAKYGVSVVAVEHQQGRHRGWLVPGPDYKMLLADNLYLQGKQESIWLLAEQESTRIGLAAEEHSGKVMDHGVALAELAVAPRSPSVGKSLRDLDFRNKFGLSVLSLWRHGRPVQEELGAMTLEEGDALLVIGEVEPLRSIRTTDEFVLLTDLEDAHDFRKAPVALLCLAIALVPPLMGLAPLAMSALAGALLMTGTGCIPAHRMGRSVDWKVLALIVGTLPLGQALEVHGMAEIAAEGVVGMLSGAGPPAILGVLFLLAAIVSITSSNAAAAVILSPLAIHAAKAAEIEPRNALLAVAYGCSCAFLVPFAHQCNLMVMTPGGYKTKDFVRVGLPLSLIVTVVSVSLLALL